MQTAAYSVPGIFCGRCRVGINSEVGRVDGITAIDVDVSARRVSVKGSRFDPAAVQRAINDAGFATA